MASSLLAIGVGSLLPMGFFFAGAAWLAGAGRDLAATLTMFSGMGLGMAGLFPMSKAAGEWRDARRRRRTLDWLEAQGEATLGGEFVDVAYEERLWHHSGLGHDVDSGVLTMGFDRLTYMGRWTNFEIPATSILGTEIRSFDAAIEGALPRLYVQWAHGGDHSTFSLSLPNRRSVRRRIEGTLDLKRRLDAWSAESLPPMTAFPFILPRSERPTRVADRGETGIPAKILAALATTVLLGTIEFVATLLAIAMGWHRTGTLAMILFASWSLPYAIFSRIIEKRLPERFRCRPAQQDALRDALCGDEASKKVEALADARLKQ